MYRRRAAIAPQGSRAVLVRVEPPKAAVQLAEHFSDKLLDLSHGMACRNPRFLQYVKKQPALILKYFPHADLRRFVIEN
jgi:hypothetical protein